MCTNHNIGLTDPHRILPLELERPRTHKHPQPLIMQLLGHTGASINLPGQPLHSSYSPIAPLLS